MQHTDLSYSTNDRYVENIWYTESLKKELSVEYKVHINHLEENWNQCVKRCSQLLKSTHIQSSIKEDFITHYFSYLNICPQRVRIDVYIEHSKLLYAAGWYN